MAGLESDVLSSHPSHLSFGYHFHCVKQALEFFQFTSVGKDEHGNAAYEDVTKRPVPEKRPVPSKDRFL